MSQQLQRNRRWVLASRPHGAPVLSNFHLEEGAVATHGEGASFTAQRVSVSRSLYARSHER